MSYIKNLSISKRISVALLFVVVLLVLLTFYIYKNSLSMNVKLDLLTNKAVPALTTIDAIYAKMADSRRSQLYIFSQDKKRDNFDVELNVIHGKYHEVNQLFQRYLSYINNQGEMNSYTEFHQGWLAYQSAAEQVNQLIEQKNFVEAAKQFEASYSLFKPLEKLTQSLYQENVRQVDEESHLVRKEIDNSLTGTIGCILVLVMLMIAINFGLRRQIGYPLKLITEFIDAIANGNLSYQVDRTYLANNEFGRLVDSGVVMQHNLASLVNNIAHAVTRLQTAIEEVSAVASQSSAGMQHQQQEIVHIASAIDQLRATVADVVQHTDESNVLANGANQVSQVGAEDITQTLEQIKLAADKMEDAASLVNQLQQETADINIVVDVICSIAEQTNLLALNAAIEAARAGERGRGFAVVADEVRTLAGRTQNSTGEISNIIKKLQHSAKSVLDITNETSGLIDSCVQQSQRTGDKMNDIKAQVSKISGMSEHIAASCNEQERVTQDLSRNIETISGSSQEVSEGASHTAKSCQELADLAAMLRNDVSRFKLM